jgi:hypothetical protein
MDTLQAFEDDEADDLAAAAAAMARHWKAQGFGEQVVTIGRAHGFEGARILLGTYLELRARRLRAERDAEEEDDARIPF